MCAGFQEKCLDSSQDSGKWLESPTGLRSSQWELSAPPLPRALKQTCHNGAILSIGNLGVCLFQGRDLATPFTALSIYRPRVNPVLVCMLDSFVPLKFILLLIVYILGLLHVPGWRGAAAYVHVGLGLSWQDGVPLSTLDSQMCGHSSVFCSLEMSVTLSFIKE